MKRTGFHPIRLPYPLSSSDGWGLNSRRSPPVDKIERNLLSGDVEILLKSGMRRSDHVGRFFELYHDPLYGDRIVEAFKQKYRSLKEENLLPDDIFMELVGFAGGIRRGSAKHESSVLAVMAYLFEECDIFEREIETSQ